MKKRLMFFLIFFGAFLLISSIVLDIIYLNKEEKSENITITNFLSNFEQNNVIYYANNYLYYNNKTVIYKKGIYIKWMNSTNILFYDSNSHFFKMEGDNGIVYMNECNDFSGYYDEAFVYEDDIFYEYSRKWSKYNVNLNESYEITKEEFNNNKKILKCEADYLIDKKANEIVVTNKLSNISKTITKKDISNEIFSDFKYNKSFNFGDYKVISDSIFIQMCYKEFWIIIRYSFNSGEMSLYDWFTHKKDKNYFNNLSFYVIDGENAPIINKYFIL